MCVDWMLGFVPTICKTVLYELHSLPRATGKMFKWQIGLPIILSKLSDHPPPQGSV